MQERYSKGKQWSGRDKNTSQVWNKSNTKPIGMQLNIFVFPKDRAYSLKEQKIYSKRATWHIKLYSSTERPQTIIFRNFLSNSSKM